MVSFDESYSFDDESDNDGSESGSAGTCTFPFFYDESVSRVEDSVGCVDESVGRICGMWSGVLFPIVIESIGDVVLMVVLVRIGVKSNGG